MPCTICGTCYAAHSLISVWSAQNKEIVSVDEWCIAVLFSEFNLLHFVADRIGSVVHHCSWRSYLESSHVAPVRRAPLMRALIGSSSGRLPPSDSIWRRCRNQVCILRPLAVGSRCTRRPCAVGRDGHDSGRSANAPPTVGARAAAAAVRDDQCARRYVSNWRVTSLWWRRRYSAPASGVYHTSCAGV